MSILNEIYFENITNKLHVVYIVNNEKFYFPPLRFSIITLTSLLVWNKTRTSKKNANYLN